MAKELPYFQFEPAEYLTKDISFCSLAAQGLFINLCSYYWNRKCQLTKNQFLRRLNELELFNELVHEGVIDLEGDMIKIKFLDIQFEKATNLSKINALNGKKGGRPKKQKTEIKANQNPIKTESKGIRKDKIRKDNTTNVDSTDLVETTEEIRNIDVDYVQLFLKQWNETRTTILKKPSNINRLGYDERDEVYEIYKAYNSNQVHTALNGLFRQKTLPHGNTSILTSPKHFINNFERYYQAGVDMNPQLYGTNE